MNIQELGWNDHWEEKFSDYRSSNYVIARVAAQHKKAYYVWTEKGETLAHITGKMRYNATRSEYPVVGDWVIITHQGDQVLIHGILERKSKFSRQSKGASVSEQIVAANIDIIFLVTGLDRDLNLRRLERYLLLSWESGCDVVIVLNKADLCDDVPEKMQDVESIAMGVPVISISAEYGEGIEELKPHIQKGKTISLLGSSGVGKSTLVNCLLGRQRQEVQTLRSKDQRGSTQRHPENSYH